MFLAIFFDLASTGQSNNHLSWSPLFDSHLMATGINLTVTPALLGTSGDSVPMYLGHSHGHGGVWRPPGTC